MQLAFLLQSYTNSCLAKSGASRHICCYFWRRNWLIFIFQPCEPQWLISLERLCCIHQRDAPKVTLISQMSSLSVSWTIQYGTATTIGTCLFTLSAGRLRWYKCRMTCCVWCCYLRNKCEISICSECDLQQKRGCL